MNEFKFNSQICTSIRQSQRLLGLGLSLYTSDMCWLNISDLPACAGYTVFKKAEDEYKLNITPAWSLHRLLEMICNKECKKHYYFDLSVDYDSMEDVYDSIIEVIERHIKENRFNKEYLKQCQTKGDTESIKNTAQLAYIEYCHPTAIYIARDT